MQKYITSLLIIFITTLSINASDDLLLNVRFDGTLKADKANGLNLPAIKRMEQPQFSKGISGNAVRLNKSAKIVYSLENNIDLKQGTIAFWIRPIDWEPSKRTKNYHWIFSANKTGAKVDRLQFFKMPGPMMLLFIGEKDNIKQIPFSTSKWKTNQWHCIAFSWNSDRAKLFVDGQLQGTVKLEKGKLPVDVGENINLQAGIETTDYDDLRIYKRTLTDSEIEALYIENAPLSANGAKKISVTPATRISKVLSSPVLDGKIASNEWAGASLIDGFLEIPELELSRRKMSMKLCYDNDALYILVQSKLGKDKKHFSSSDENVWSAPSAEILFQCGIQPDLAINHFALNIFDRHFSQLKSDIAWNPLWTSVSTVDNEIWTAEVKIPFESLGQKPPQPGTVWRFNFGRNFIAPKNFANPSVTLAYADVKAFWDIQFAESGQGIGVDYSIDPALKSLNLKSVNKTEFETGDSFELYIKKMPVLLTRIVKKLNNISTSRGQVVTNMTDLNIDSFVKNGITANLPGAGRYVALATIKEKTGKVIYRQLLQFIIRDSFSVALKFLSKSQKMFVEWELNSPVNPPFEINANIIDDNGKIVRTEKQKIESKTFNGKIEFDMSQMKKLDYTAEVTLSSKTFKQVREIAFKCYYNAPWIGFEQKTAKSHKVPAPWTPIEIDKKNIKTLTLNYQLGAQGLPESIFAAGKELLAQPINLKFSTGNSAFKPSGDIKWQSKYSDIASFIIPFKSQNATAKLTGSVEFDGMIRYDLTITPNDYPAQLTDMVLDIPLQNDCAELKYPYCGPYQKWNICDVEGKVNKYYADAFMPHIWVGNTSRGLAWFAESNELYRPFGSEKVVELKRLGDQTVLRINMVTSPLELSKPVSYTFGIQGTPMKIIAPDWTSRTLSSCISTKRQDKAITMGYTTGGEYHVMAGIPYPTKDPDRAKRWVESVHKVKDRRAVVYATSNGIGSKSPQYCFFEQEWKNPLSCDTWSLASRGEYHQGTSPSVSTWRDFFLWTVYKALEEYNIDGLYYDFGTVAPVYNPDAGCGFKYNGKQYPTWPIFSDRQMRKQVYQLVMDKRGHADFVYHNYSKSMAPIMSFASMLLDGEVYQQRTGVIGAKITDDYTKLIPLSRLRAMFGAQWGCTPYFLAKLASEGTARTKATRCIIAMMMPHGIPIWGFYCDIPELNKYTAVQDKFGIGNSKFFPCYELNMNKLLSPAPQEDKVLVGYWLKKDSALVVVGNLSDKKYSGVLNVGAILTGTNKAENTCVAGQNMLITAKGIAIEIPAKDYLLLKIDN